MAEVLVVDDESAIRRSLKTFLERHEHRVATAEGADEALALLRTKAFDVVVADIMMPGMSGLDLLDRVREIDADTEVVLITGHPDQDTAIEAVHRGAFDYLSKPLSGLRVVKVVERAAGVRQNKREKQALAEERKRHGERLEQLVLHRAAAQHQTEDRLQRVALDLHDVVARNLLETTRLLQALRGDGNNPDLVRITDEARTLIETSVRRLHSQAHELSPIVLSDQGIEAALQGLVERFEVEQGVQCRFRDDGEEKPLTQEVMTTAYRCVADLLSNVAQHSQATRSVVAIARVGDHVEISVTDDGAGFDTQVWREQLSERESFGLVGIEARIAALDGDVEIRSHRQRGTCVVLHLPLRGDSQKPRRGKD